MNRRWTTILPLLALLVAPAALAQDLETRGTLTAKDDTTLTIETAKGQVLSFEIDEHSLLPAELSVGDTISVHHRAGLGDSNLQAITEVLIADEFTATPATHSAEVLPQTAGPLAALALIGLAAAGGAAGLRRRRS